MSDQTAQSVAFVRKTPLPELPPPANAAGPVAWIRTNLFSGIFNSILTLIAFYLVIRFFMSVFPWFTNGIWDAASIRECRDQLAGATGGCFAVLVDRWDHLIFGFTYPPEGYWRIVLAFVLLMVAAAPALFASLPRRMLFFTAFYPFLAFWLIWGGPIWVSMTLLGIILATGYLYKLVAETIDVSSRRVVAMVIGVVCGAGLAYLLFVGAKELMFIATSIGTTGLVGTVAFFLFWGAAIFTFVFFIPMGIFIGYAIYNSYEDGGLVSLVVALLFFGAGISYLIAPIAAGLNAVLPVELPAVASRDMGGFMLNMILGTVCVSLSIPLGILLALGRQSHMPLIKGVCVIFIEFIRGVPLITLLFVANVMLAYFLPPSSNFDLILRVIIMITMFSSAYIAEVIRGGLAALPKGQYEAADSLGLNYNQATRLIILPQALKISIPGIVNVAVGLFKDTTLVSIISMFDLVGMIRGPIQNSTEWISIYWEVYGFGALLFFVVCYSISQYSQWLERQLATDHR